MQHPTQVFETRHFSLWQGRVMHRHKARLRSIHVRDRYTRLQHRVGRLVFGQGVRLLEWHYVRRPDIAADSPHNYVQKLIFFPTGIRAWRQHMPGGFATYAVHNPEHRRLSSGEKVDVITRRLFRHSADGIGLRSRAYAMSWWVYEHFATTNVRQNARIRWLSIASGTGQPTFDAGELYEQQPEYFLSDLSDTAMQFSRELAEARGLEMAHVHTIRSDITNRTSLESLLREAKPDVIDMMGLVEYLDDVTIVRVLRILKKHHRGLVCFTNMRPEHPQLQTHQRGLGWPGITVRSVDTMLALISRAGISLDTVDVLLPDDKVYAVYCLS